MARMATNAVKRGEPAPERRETKPALLSHAVDLVHLARQTLGDRALEIELLSLFDRQSALTVRQLKAASGAAQRKARGDLAHLLKGSARAVGAVRVAAAALAYEDRLATVSEPPIGPLAEAVEEARAAIADLLADR